ncbi:MAG: hypothetical protein ACI4RT_01865 [Candidatus Spyradenecus sp.]
MYFNRLASDAVVPAGTYGSITTTSDIRATTFTAATALSNTASAPEIVGSYTNIIKNGTYTDTHTVAGWFNLAALPSSESTYNNIYLARSMTSSNDHAGYKVAVNSAGAIAVGKLGSSDGFNGSPVLTAEGVVSADTWVYLTVAVTKTSGANTATVQVYINGASVETGSGTFATNLNGNSCARVDIGAGVSKAAGFYVDTTALSEVSTIQALATNETYNAFVGGEKSASLSGADNVWSTVTWTPTGVPTDANDVTLTATDAATLAVDADTTIYSLTVDGTGSLTFSGSNSLTVTESTTVSADTNVSGITASLGAVTIDAGKTLTMDSSNTLSSLAGTYSDATPSQVIYDATAGSVTADGTLRAAIRDFAGVVTIKGSGANGMELPYVNNVANALASRIVFDGGTHTFKYGREDQQRFATAGHGDEYPTIDVKTGTTLNFYLKDLSGWNGSVGTTPAVIRAREGSTLNLKNYNGSGFFRDRLILDKDATVTAENRFTLHGGAQSAENLAQIAMLDSAEAISATLGGQVNLTNVGGNGEAGTKGASISVGTNATLKATALFAGTSAGSLTKEGAGVLELSSTASTVASPLTINGGKVVIKDGSSWGTGTITVASGAGLDVEVSEANPQSLDNVSGSGAVSVSGAGVVNMTYSTFSATSLTLSVAAESTLKIHVAYSDVQSDLTVANVTLAEGQNAIFVLPDGREVTGSGTSVSAMQYYTWTPSESDTNWNTLANWSYNGTTATQLPGASDDVMISLTAATTVTLPETVAVKTVLISGGDLTLSGGTLTTSAVTSSASETLTVASGAGLVLDGSTNTENTPAQSSSKVTVNSGATLTTKGYVTLSAENVFNGTLTVESGIASVNAADSSLAGTITIESGATMKNLRTSDALKYGGNATVNVKGTLDMGSTRWTMGTNNKVNLYTGGEITGAGQGSNGALDWYRAGALEVLANGDATTATISANLRTRDQGNPTFTVASGLTLNISGLINGGTKITIASGEVKLSAANTYTGGTEINENGIVTIGNATALSSSGTISGAGIINVPGVLPSLASSRFADTWTGRVKISGSNKGEISIGNYGPTVEFAGASGYLGPANGTTYTQNIILTGNGWTSVNGNSEKTFIFQGTLSGDGLLKITSAPSNGHFYKFEGDVSGFTGSVTVDSNHAIFFAKDANDSITFTQNKGKIVINKPVTVGGTWTANNGIVVNTDAELTGAAGTGGTLSGAVTTANNAAFKVVGGAITLPGTLGSVANGAATFGSEVSVADGATLKLTSATPHTFTGAISGTGTVELTPAVTLAATSANVEAKLTGAAAVTIGDGTNTSAVTLTNANTYAGGTTIKTGANLTLNGTTDTTSVLPEGKTATVEAGGTLTLTKGIGYITVDGAGEVVVDGTFTFGRSGSFANTLTAPVTVNADATLQIRAWTGYALTVPALTVNGTLKNDGYSGATLATVTVPATGTLAGTGTIEMATTLESGATLDASAGPLTVTKDVTCNGTVTVTLPEAAAAGTTILTCTNPADVVGKLTTTSMPDGLKFAATETAVVLAKAGNYTVDGQTFETLQEALASITSGDTKTGTITVEASAPDTITLTEQILVDDVAANITLDLGGKTLSAAKDSLTLATATGDTTASGVIWLRQGALTVKNGTITTDGRAIRVGVINYTSAPIVADNSAVLTLESGLTVTSTGEYTVTAFHGAKVVSAADITASGADYYALSGNGSANGTGNNNTTIEITGGLITNTDGVALYHPQGGTLTISGGTISGLTALHARAGAIAISGGTFSGYGPVADYDATANGVSALGDAVVIDNHSGYQALSVSITGGNFTAQYGAPIASYSNGNEAYPVLTGFVSGGKFNQAIAGSLCADGTCCVKTSGSAFYPWTIGELPAITGGEGGDVAIDTPEAKDVIGEIIAADATAPTSVEVVAGTKSGVALPPAEVADALAIFGSSATTTSTTDGKLTITVSYDFGIDSMAQTESGIVITAKVQKPDGAEATFAEGVTVTLVDENGNEIATATPAADGTATFAAKPAADLVGKQLKVKATK